MYETNPNNPVDFLAKWLLNYSRVEEVQDQRLEALTAVGQEKSKHAQKRAEISA